MRAVLLRRVPPGLPKDIEALLEELESFVEGICNEIRGRGYDLHGYLLGAA
jgi:hypothetical protein